MVESCTKRNPTPPLDTIINDLCKSKEQSITILLNILKKL